MHYPCGAGAHTLADTHTEVDDKHWHMLTYYWTDSGELACGVWHKWDHTQNDAEIRTWSDGGSFEEYDNVTFNRGTSRFELARAGTDTARSQVNSLLIAYCNNLFSLGGNPGAYPTFEGVTDACKVLFRNAGYTRPADGGL